MDYTNFFRALGNLRLDNSTDEKSESALTNMFNGKMARESWNTWMNQYRIRLKNEGASNATEPLPSERMNRVNPKFVLRNYLAQKAIDEATQNGTYAEIDRLLHVLRDPFSEHPGMEHYGELPPEWAKNLVVSCSS